MFVIASINADKVRNTVLQEDSLEQANLAWKCWTRLDVCENDKHSSLLVYGIDYGRKRFIVQALEEKENSDWGRIL